SNPIPLSSGLWSRRLGALHLSQSQSPARPQNPRLGSAVEKEVAAMMACRLRLHQLRLVGVRPTCCSPSRDFAAVKSQKIQPPKKKKRLDEACLERYQQYSRTYIQSWILQGKVHVNGRIVNKAGTQVSDKSVIEIKAEIPKYVCRAGHKLEAAIKEFGVDCDGKIALDSGLSTGGFTDCLLQHGASHVYGVDVGYGQVTLLIEMSIFYPAPLLYFVSEFGCYLLEQHNYLNLNMLYLFSGG
uniref:RNA-binding S4 domain-containing protein n=1 Tax=Aegilops tauschii subsp. strangulata TaxID=200361 RepID=A0A453HGD2_AEGTS